MSDETSIDRRQFVRGISFAAISASVAAAEAAQTTAARAGWVLRRMRGS
jgi:hypothetical protein